jgi:hypothetical protein
MNMFSRAHALRYCLRKGVDVRPLTAPRTRRKNAKNQLEHNRYENINCVLGVRLSSPTADCNCAELQVAVKEAYPSPALHLVSTENRRSKSDIPF